MHSMSTERGVQDGNGSEEAAERLALLGRFEVSGLSLAGFCRAEAVSVASVHRWRGLLGNHVGQEAQQVEAASPAFLDLGALQSAGNIKPRSRSRHRRPLFYRTHHQT